MSTAMALLADWWWLLVLVVVLLAAHRLALALERKGLIYYRQVPTPGVASAMLNYQRLFEPAVEWVIEYQQSGDLTIQTTGEPEPVRPDLPLGVEPGPTGGGSGLEP